jgi:4-amino-4-deoxy-L-arabinose transferase-like glycosyltransferase
MQYALCNTFMSNQFLRFFPLLLYLSTFALAALFAVRTPQWQAPDEPAHYAYVATVAQTGLPPVLVPACYNEQYKNALVGSNFAEPIAFERFCYEGHQPPLFYYLAAPFYALGGGSLLVLRLLCAAIGALVPVLAYLIIKKAMEDMPLAVAVGALVAVVPQHLAMIGTLNNDALCFAVVAGAVYQMVRILRWQGYVPQRQWLGLGILVGIALITKTLAWIALPLAGFTVLLQWRQERKQVGGESRKATGAFWKNSVTLGAIALLFIVPWFTRNTLTYGAWDVMGLQIHDEIAVGQPRTEAEIERRGVWGTITNGAQTTFNSFWGQFGWMKAPLQQREYQILFGFHLLAGVGWGVLISRSVKSNTTLPFRADVLLLFGAWLFINLGLLIYYNLEFVQYQGRYLFSALTPIAFFLMAGLGVLAPQRWRILPWAALILFLLYIDGLALLERLPGMMNY